MVFILVSIAFILPSASSAIGPCEKIENTGSLGSIETCFMHSTAIDSTDFLITSPRSESLEIFHAYQNKKLEHLPRNLGGKFPNLRGLLVQCCSIKEISTDQFKGFNKLQRLSLAYNQIEVIDDDVFEYIPEVELIILSE